MTRTSLVLDAASLDALRRLAKRLQASQSEVVRRSLRLLDQRESAAPATPAHALDQLAATPAAAQPWSKVKSRIRAQRKARHDADLTRG